MFMMSNLDKRESIIYVSNPGLERCTKPDRKEFQKIALATAIGFGIMGFIGFFVKLIHIPINNIIVQ
ncbi:Protein transport protein Sec61 subunit gamma [Exaiptasia diaphana]|nr:Protein transport protein Sec61 subunit gamma [Exaiptasia diaphana]